MDNPDKKLSRRNFLKKGMEGLSKAAAAAALGKLGIDSAQAQIYQRSEGSNSPNIIGGGNVVIGGGRGEEGKPNVSTRKEGPIRQESTRDNSPNIITEGDQNVIIIDGKVVVPKKKLD